ncbi:hypothetical protein [Paraburkholderia caledonica]|uniref:Uncharacterized protein n=1 Tax=Paraburkholderia caledonica TaxID=134536 RepID=A0AB73IQ27_9BURK|nr:hypothetical protein [Paraburkholderia caledonica]
MSDIKHTSGPWQWDDEVWTDYDPAERAPWLIGADGRLILTGQIRCQTEADARLISAAPELLEALRLCYDHCRLYHPEVERNNVGEAVRSALAKATGA